MANGTWKRNTRVTLEKITTATSAVCLWVHQIVLHNLVDHPPPEQQRKYMDKAELETMHDTVPEERHVGLRERNPLSPEQCILIVIDEEHECQVRGECKHWDQPDSICFSFSYLLRYSENLQANIPQSLPFICWGMSCKIWLRSMKFCMVFMKHYQNKRFS